MLGAQGGVSAVEPPDAAVFVQGLVKSVLELVRQRCRFLQALGCPVCSLAAFAVRIFELCTVLGVLVPLR